jgi:serine O-acetyltransferase
MAKVWRRALEDIDAVLTRDPAARHRVEVLFSYPGLHALWWHRVSHTLWQAGLRLPARVLAARTHRYTGVDIHPAAVIGRRVVIDHGTGVVIGETARVGDDCLIFHGVTLGGRGGRTGVRHPRIGNGVVLGAGATVLGPVNVGDGAKIGATALVLRDIPAGAVVRGHAATSDTDPDR